MDMEKFPSVFGVHLVFWEYPSERRGEILHLFSFDCEGNYVYLLIGVRSFSCLKSRCKT
jgi:hypothetical protein